MYRKISVTLAFLLALLPVFPALAQTFTENSRHVVDGYNYEFWADKRGGEGSMTLTGGGTYECEWKDVFNILFRTGKKLGSQKTHEEYGDIFLEYAAEHRIDKGNVSYLCVYGWTKDPMVEFYIIESHGNYKPPGGKGFLGTIEADGGAYEVYTDVRVDMPSIEGDKTTFPQYFSIRTDKRTGGTISVSEHFRAWEHLGLDMSGKLYEVALCVEGFESSGYANVYEHVLTFGGVEVGEGDGLYVTGPAALPQPPSPSPDEPSEAPAPSEAYKPPAKTEPETNPWIIAAIIAGGGLIFGGLIALRRRKT